VVPGEDEAHLNRIEDLLNEARRAEWRSRELTESIDYNGAVEAAQHCIELSIKAMYQLVGLDPPKKHDAGTELEKVVRRLDIPQSYGYVKESLGRMRLISAMWAWAHNTSIYGCLDIPASRLFKEKDARTALDHAAEVLSGCQTTLVLMRTGQAKRV